MPLALLLVAVPLVAVMVLTGRGQLQRGGGAGIVLSAGLFFPATWTVWYVADRRAQRSGAASDTRTGWT
jgi:hypothetical protein